MAWRIDEAVLRGEIDNTKRGRVTGKIWFLGRAEPVQLELDGNCWRDLAGRRLEFSNPQPKTRDLRSFAPLQRGVTGDLTASRKVKVMDVPLAELEERYQTLKEWMWHWENSLHLEWFSEGNGRVMIETVGFNLKISGEPDWVMTEDDEIEQHKANALAMTDFMDRLVEVSAEEQPEPKRKPPTEEEAEAQQARSDQLANRVETRLVREGVDQYDRILDEEIDRQRREHGEPEMTPEQEAERAEWIDEANRAAQEALENPDPEVEEELRYEHPLVLQVSDLALVMRRAAKKGKWRPQDASQEHPVSELLDSTMIAGPKLAGALNGREWPPEIDFCAHTIVRLKRARGYLEDALRAADSCREDQLIPAASLKRWTEELQGFAAETDALITELREKLARGCD